MLHVRRDIGHRAIGVLDAALGEDHSRIRPTQATSTVSFLRTTAINFIRTLGLNITEPYVNTSSNSTASSPDLTSSKPNPKSKRGQP